MKKRIVVYLIVFQLIIVFGIGYVIYQKKNDVLGAQVSVSPINSKAVQLSPIDNLKYFYQLKENTKISLEQAFIRKLGYPPNFKVVYNLNKDGLNQVKDFTIKKPDRVYRIITIGDSFTFGLNVNTQANYPTQLQHLLNNKCTLSVKSKFQVINLGVEGYDFQYAVERYKLKGQKYDPDLVLWLIIPDDFMRVNEYLRPKLIDIAHAIEASGRNYDLQDRINRTNWAEAENESVEAIGGTESVIELQKKYLSDLNNLYDKKLATFTFKNTPQEYKDILTDYTHSRPKSYFYGDLFDILTVPEYHLADNHPTEKGYSVIVQNMFDYLTKNNIIPCRG